MKKLLAVCLCLASNVFAQSNWCLNRHVSVTVDYAYFRRQEVRDLRLVERVPAIFSTNEDVKGKKVLDTEDLEDRLGWENGIRGELSIYKSACTLFDFIYTYHYPWEATSTVNATEGTVLRFPFKDLMLIEDYTDADRVRAKYKTFLEEAEANYWGHLTPQRVNYFSAAWNFGFRYFCLDEKFEMEFIRGLDASVYTIKTQNYLYGVQLGAVLEINPDAC